MKSLVSSTGCVLVVVMVLFCATYASADDTSTEIQGFYQTYKDFSFKLGSGYEDLDLKGTRLGGGGFTIAQNLAPWFAFWSQTAFYGSAENEYIKARVINNLEGLRFQKRFHGPIEVYGKVGMGFSHTNLSFKSGSDIGGEYKFALAYGGGAFIWVKDSFGFVLDASQMFMGLPNLTNASGRDRWDAGLTLTTGIAIRF
jgi:hypothetical protein